MYLIDTSIILELQKGIGCNSGIKCFFNKIKNDNVDCFISVLTISEIQRISNNLIDKQGHKESIALENWMLKLIKEFSSRILNFGIEEAKWFGYFQDVNNDKYLLGDSKEYFLEKQIAAIAMKNDLIVVTGNTKIYKSCEVQSVNPYS